MLRQEFDIKVVEFENQMMESVRGAYVGAIHKPKQLATIEWELDQTSASSGRKELE